MKMCNKLARDKYYGENKAGQGDGKQLWWRRGTAKARLALGQTTGGGWPLLLSKERAKTQAPRRGCLAVLRGAGSSV